MQFCYKILFFYMNFYSLIPHYYCNLCFFDKVDIQFAQLGSAQLPVSTTFHVFLTEAACWPIFEQFKKVARYVVKKTAYPLLQKAPFLTLKKTTNKTDSLSP